MRLTGLDDLPPNTPPDRRLYVCIQQAVYRHRVIGAFDTLLRAKMAASTAIEEEHDHYHRIDIVSCEHNRAGETFVGTVRPIILRSKDLPQGFLLVALHFDTEE